MEIELRQIVLCKFYFSDLSETKNRPVLVFKDNLPYNDFLGIPLSSKIEKLEKDEILIENGDLVEGQIPKNSKCMVRKSFIISKSIVIKSFGFMSQQKFKSIQNLFCKYHECS